ncbi:MAG: hypothetical protein INF91_12285 [Alphaproteobacteria bacterium]|nr:hypothetical protein [Alphaproteobacteria bacterium]
MWRHVFKNRWIALTWSALICWQAYDYVKPPETAAISASAPVVDAATSNCLAHAGNDLAEIARCSEVARRARG